MKRRAPARPPEEDDIVLGDPILVENMDLPQSSADIVHELAKIAGKRGPVELSSEQLVRLCAYGRVVAQYNVSDATIIVLCDDFAQHLVAIKGASAPHFVFFPN